MRITIFTAPAVFAVATLDLARAQKRTQPKQKPPHVGPGLGSAYFTDVVVGPDSNGRVPTTQEKKDIWTTWCQEHRSSAHPYFYDVGSEFAVTCFVKSDYGQPLVTTVRNNKIISAMRDQRLNWK